MENDSELFKIEDRHCPICGNFIKAGSPTHHCSDEDLKNLYKEDEELELDRTYDDKLSEFDEFYNSDNYYDIDIEDE